LPRFRHLTRRDLLRAWGVAGASYWLAATPGWAQDVVPAAAAVDHLLLGAADLGEGMAWVEEATGVKAMIGGSHPGVGTRNALISLGGRQYLEIIAPDPEQAAYKPVAFQTELRALTQPRLFAWAAATDDITAVADTALRMALPVAGPTEGSRERPDGRVLRWQSLLIRNRFNVNGAEPIPFFIEWAAGSPHPSQDSPEGCELLSFEFEHITARRLMSALQSLGIEAKVTQARDTRLRATLWTPKGMVELS